MNDNKETMWMMQQDFKESQRRENYRRAEAFLTWKFGSMRYEVDRFIKGSGMDWPSLFVEFCEKVEEELLTRTRHIEELHFDTMNLKAMTSTVVPFMYQEKEKVDGKV
jgi:hypothetical protein